MHLEKLLENYGLSKKEARVYLASLELGPSSVQKISQKTMLARSTTYDVLEGLRQKGLISIFRKKGVKYFNAETPEKIAEGAQNIADLLKKALPQLQAKQLRTRTQPIVRFYQGKQGMKTILTEILKEAHELSSFCSAEDLFTALENYFPRFVQQRVKRKIPVRVIMRESAKARERKQLGPQQLRKVKIIPAKYEHHGITLIWNHKIAMFSFKENLEVVVIESRPLTAMQKASFDFIWNSLPD